MNATHVSTLLITGLCLWGWGCVDAKVPSATPKPKRTTNAARTNPQAMAEARDYYKKNCKGCHGKTGRGNGPAAVALRPKPKDYSEALWQASVTNEYIETIILKGGVAVGKSPYMIPRPDLNDKPEVLKALRKIVRQFGAMSKR